MENEGVGEGLLLGAGVAPERQQNRKPSVYSLTPVAFRWIWIRQGSPTWLPHKPREVTVMWSASDNSFRTCRWTRNIRDWRREKMWHLHPLSHTFLPCIQKAPITIGIFWLHLVLSLCPGDHLGGEIGGVLNKVVGTAEQFLPDLCITTPRRNYLQDQTGLFPTRTDMSDLTCTHPGTRFAEKDQLSMETTFFDFLSDEVSALCATLCFLFSLLKVHQEISKFKKRRL